MALSASPSDGMLNLNNQQSGGDGDDLEDGEIFDDEDETPVSGPVAAPTPPVPPLPPNISAVEEKKKLSPVRKGVPPPPRPRRTKRPREEDRLLKSNKQRRRSEESEKSKDKDDSEDDEMRELSPLRLGMDWDRGHHRPMFPDEMDEDEDDDDLLRRGRGFGNRTRRGRNGRGVGNRRGIGRRENHQICKFYLQGKCQRGAECPFAHSQRKFEVCKFYMNDCCAKKDRCLFLHSEFPCKYHYLGMKCYAGKKCKFSHGKISSQLRANLLRDSKECEFLQHIDSPPHKEEAGRSRRERDRDRERDREHRDRDYRDKGRDKERGKDRDRERDKKDDKDRFTLHFKVDPRTISDEEEGNRTPMPSPSPDSSSDRGSRSPEHAERRNLSPKQENPLPEPKDNGISEELPDLPADLPKHQRELYKRIQQQQREVKTFKTEEEEVEKETEDYKDEDWYSSEEEDNSKKMEPLTALLNKLKQQPTIARQPASPPPQTSLPPPIVVPPILPDIDISAVSKLLSTVRETIQQKQQKCDVVTPATLPTLLVPPMNTATTTSAVPAMNTAAPVIMPLSPPSQSAVIPPTLNPLPPLASLISESVPPPEKRRMRDPRLRGNSTEDDVDLRMGPRGDVDLRQLPFKPAPVHTPANEIDASVTSHPPVAYRLIPISPPPPPDYSNVHSKNVNDPRLKKPLPGSGSVAILQPMLPPMGGALRPPLEGPRDPRQRNMAANDPRRRSSLLLQRDSDLRQPHQNFNLVNDVDLRMHPPAPHLAFK